MSAHTLVDSPSQKMWHDFAREENLSDHQLNQFKRYMTDLLAKNEQMSLTTIVDPADIIAYHFQDSLRIGNYSDFSSAKMIVDVGTGGGFPGIPLKIKYPHLQVILVEVNNKKVAFLRDVIQALGLENIEVCDLDWRTFLRKTDYAADYIVTRASLSIDEFLRMFKPSSSYKDAGFVYWASKEWKAEPAWQQYIVREESYQVKNRRRRFIFFSNKK